MPRPIPVGTEGLVAVVDTKNYDRFILYKWFPARNHTGIIYAKRRVRTEKGWRQSAMHREVLGFRIGDGAVVDHRDGDGLNNQKDNLRQATGTQNRQNARRTTKNKSGVIGVYPSGSDAWTAFIGVKNRLIYLGYFTDKSDAADARKRAEKRYFGEFARKA